jgi:N-acetylglucosaminyl-diphospho-decaprenol L-rhamnosyltransferase
MAVDVSVVIITYNSAHMIGGLLDSLPAALAGLSAETVVVDNGSTDGTRELVAARPEVTLIGSDNIGYAGGLNLGVASAQRAPAILVLNPDTRLQPDSVPPLLAALSEPGCGIAAPQIRDATGNLDLSLRREPSLLRAIGLNATGWPVFSERLARAADYDSPRVVDWAVGAALLMSRQCFDAVGGWDATYFLYSEETDFCLRARDLGFRTRYVPESVVVHVGAQSGQDDVTHTMQIVNRVRLYRRRHGLLAGACYQAATVLSELSWVLRGHRNSRAAILGLLVPRRRPPSAVLLELRTLLRHRPS